MADDFDHIDVQKANEIAKIRLKVDSLRNEPFETVTKELVSLVEVHGYKKVLVDLENVDYLPSTALGGFVALEKKLLEVGGELRLCGLSDAVGELFDITGLHQVIDIRSNEQAALDGF